jgi:dynein heavy chain 2, cytosolic
MIKKQDALKELQARVVGEVTLREAIQELKIWTEEARFELTSLVSNGKETPLIKEWKELMTKVSDN